MSFTVLPFVLIVLVLGCAFVRTRIRSSRLSRLSWDDLLAKLVPVPIDEISRIAVDYLYPRKGQLEFATYELWNMIGEADGLRRMYANAEVLIALAGYAQRWNRHESLVVAERMRRDGIILRRATLGLSLGLTLGFDKARGPFSVQEAASAYYLMRARVLALYETSHAGRFPRLVAAL